MPRQIWLDLAEELHGSLQILYMITYSLGAIGIATFAIGLLVIHPRSPDKNWSLTQLEIGGIAGFATGVVVGMAIEERLAIGYVHMRVISSRRGSGIAERLRSEGYAVTEVPARGKDGMVTMLNCSVLRKDIERLRNLVNEVDQEAFITSEDIRPVRRGFWRA